ncbi:MAG: hypothetical protein LBR98_06965 [Syntrophomonadaceae bacterium]|jgi:hypothetical protein|nr:hypothetical protein [Syntrophomonadaceae bacterium]
MVLFILELPLGGLVTPYIKGVTRMVTWSELLLFAVFVTALVTLLDKNKDK